MLQSIIAGFEFQMKVNHPQTSQRLDRHLATIPLKNFMLQIFKMLAEKIVIANNLLINKNKLICV